VAARREGKESFPYREKKGKKRLRLQPGVLAMEKKKKENLLSTHLKGEGEKETGAI